MGSSNVFRRKLVPALAAAMGLALLAWGPPGALAQAQPSPEELKQQRLDRQERLRLHREEMLKRLESAKAEREERVKEENEKLREARVEQAKQQRELLAQRKVDKALSEGKPIPQDAVEALAGRQSAQREAAYDRIETLLYASPLSVNLIEGDRAAIDYVLYNKSGTAVTEVCLALQYQPWALKPVALYAPELKKAFGGDPQIFHDAERGLLTFRSASSRPAALKTGTIATIVWEGVAPIRESEMPFVFREEMGTAIRLGVEDKLGEPGAPGDGAIDASFRVSPLSQTRLEVRRVPGGGLVSGMFDDEAATSEVGLFLASERIIVHEGEEFSVVLYLNNPDHALFDRVEAIVRFDPETLEVVDFDQGASIRRGVNINDAAGAGRFQFDHFLANDANNRKGEIVYRAASGGARNQGEGPLAVIRFRAKKTSRHSRIWLRHADGPFDREGSRVTRLGENILDRQPLEEAASLRILPALPAPPEPTEEEQALDAAIAEAAAAAEEEALREEEEAETLSLSVGRLSFFNSKETSPTEALPRRERSGR